ncbi:hypothetical protein [Mycolicibacterium palauense]|uniref:hypothetical protein n=1 Tax=Mycolicibacterium palauense TaxID=2034511 RepID=UPI000BFEE419|nr:hypothetical protein [Mycolicibacterium palauense]
MNATDTPVLRRFSLDPGHWRQVRRVLMAEAVALAVVGGTGLGLIWAGVAVRIGGADGVVLTAAFCGLLLLVAVGAAVSATRRSLALWFTALVAVGALALVIVSAAFASHSSPGLLGFTDAATLLYALAFVFHFAMGVWLIPDRIEGPEWIRGGAGPHGRGAA